MVAQAFGHWDILRKHSCDLWLPPMRQLFLTLQHAANPTCRKRAAVAKELGIRFLDKCFNYPLHFNRSVGERGYYQYAEPGPSAGPAAAEPSA